MKRAPRDVTYKIQWGQKRCKLVILLISRRNSYQEIDRRTNKFNRKEDKKKRAKELRFDLMELAIQLMSMYLRTKGL